ncbi:surface-adhesin E family protein [Massilia sp. TWP1-3-3]|uniref:surface-adhesin E family protein n=1 Tax=Massilia sp. TWP1-3-3 TaxID=2804573 RepID=UPI003CEF49B8
MIKKVKKSLLVLAIGGSCAVSAHASEWELVRNNVHFEMSIDKSSVLVKDGAVRAWVRTSYAEPKKEPRTGIQYQSELILRKYHCKNRESALIQGFLTAGANGLGGTVDAIEPDQTRAEKMDAVVPETIGEVQLDVACEAANGGAKVTPSDWISAGKSTSLEAFLDRASVVVKGNMVRAAVRIAYPAPKLLAIPGAKSYSYQSIEALADYDCARGQMLPLSMTAFVAADFSGKIVQSVKPSELALEKMKAVTPQSLNATQLAVVCKYKQYLASK